MNYDSFIFLDVITCRLTIYLRLKILGSKRKFPKRRNFAFDASNGFGGIFVQSYYIRILPVKVPRYAQGTIIDCDIYDCFQGKKTEKIYRHHSYNMSHHYQK